MVYMRALPVALCLVQRISGADPVSTGSLADTQVQHQGHGNYKLVQSISGIDEGLLDILGKGLPGRDGLLRSNVRADDVDVQILRESLRGDGQDGGLVGRRCKGRSIVNDYAGAKAELGLDGGEHSSNVRRRRKVGLDGEVAIVGLAVGAFAGSEDDTVAVLLEGFGDGSADTGARAEDEDDGRHVCRLGVDRTNLWREL